MAGYSPEKEGERSNKGHHKNGNPYRSTKQEFLDIRLAYAECTERGGLRLAEKDEDRIELILMRYEAEDGDGERDEKLQKH